MRVGASTALLAAWGALAACSRAEKSPPPPPAPAETPDPGPGALVVAGPVTVTSADGTARPARSGGLPRAGRLATGAGGRAAITLPDGSRVQIEGDDEVEWVVSGQEVIVTAGRAAVVTAPAAAGRPRAYRLLVKTPFGVARIPDQATEMVVEVDRKRGRVGFDLRLGSVGFTDQQGRRFDLRMGSRIEVRVKGIEIIRPDGTRATLAADQLDAVDSGGGAGVAAAEAAVPLPAPPPASLALPMATDLQVHGDRLAEVTLGWPADLPVARLEVARDHKFKQVTLTGRPEGAHVNVVPPRFGSLYWRALDGGGKELRRGKVRFLPDGRSSSRRGRGAGAAVSDDGAPARLYHQSVAPAVTFAFTPHPRAASYRLRVVRVGAEGKVAVSYTGRHTRHTVRAGALPDGEYRWTATPIDRGGQPLGEPRENRLSVAYDNAHAQLLIQRPRSGQRVPGRTVRVQGVAPLDSQLYVNGQRAPVDRQGRFDFPVDRASALIFRLVARDGQETLWVRALKARS